MPLEKSQLRLVAIVLAAVTAALVAFYLLVLRVAYVPVYENIRESDASAIVAELDAAGVPYRLGNQGRDVLVPEDRVAEARVRVAGADLALGGTVGFELFNDTDMGLTEFAQKINLQRALQGELARTIMSMEGVAFARVHLALPERSIFRSEQAHPTAAVTLQMKPGRPLSPQRIEGLRQLVASSVPDLEAQAVVVLDDKGDLVSGVPGSGDGLDPALDERAALEQYFEARAHAAVAAQRPGLRFQVTVNTRREPAASTASPDTPSGAAPGREGLVLSVVLRTADTLPEGDRGMLEAVLAGALELDPARGDTLAFSVGPVVAVGGAPAPVPAWGDPAPAAAQAPAAPADASWSWLTSRWTFLALALGAITVLLVRPRRKLDEEEATSFAALLKGGMADGGPAGAA